MRAIIMNYGAAIVWLLAICEALLGVLALRKGKALLNLLVAGVCFGLAVDAFIQALGSAIGAGAFLQGISQVRYILHGVLVPLLLPIAVYAYGITGKTAQKVLWAVTGIIVAAGVAMGFAMVTEPVDFCGVLRYAMDAGQTPAFAQKINRILSIGGVLPLIGVGVVHLARHKRPMLLLSGVLMFAFAALAPATGNMDLNFILSMVGELLMVLCMDLELKNA